MLLHKEQQHKIILREDHGQHTLSLFPGTLNGIYFHIGKVGIFSQMLLKMLVGSFFAELEILECFCRFLLFLSGPVSNLSP